MMVFMSHTSHLTSSYQKMAAGTREQQAIMRPPSPYFLFSMQLPGMHDLLLQGNLPFRAAINGKEEASARGWRMFEGKERKKSFGTLGS